MALKRFQNLMTSKHKKIFVLTDIHGCATELNLLIEQLPLTAESLIIFLGDYIDRGENSSEVVDTILRLREEYEVVTLKGNHEQMFIHFLEKRQTPLCGSFICNGGGSTLASYGGDAGRFSIPTRHISFIYSLKLYHQTEDYFFVHAGLPSVKLLRLNFIEPGYTTLADIAKRCQKQDLPLAAQSRFLY